MELLIKSFMALLFGIGVCTFLNIIPIFNAFAAPLGVCAGLAAGTYLLTRSD